MRRLLGLLGVCTMLLCASWLGAHAQIAIAGDAKGDEMFMDVVLRDADLSEALTALFSTTNGKYQLNIGAGVVGRVARLQLTQTPFERALDAILGPDFSYTKQQLGTGSYLYRISGRKTGDVSPSAPRGGDTTFAPPSSSVSSNSTASGSGSSTSSSTLHFLQSRSATDNTGGAGATAGGSAASESAFIRLILVANLDLESLSKTLGGTAISLFVQSSTGEGGSGGSSRRSGGGSTRSNNSNYNDTSNTTTRTTTNNTERRLSRNSTND